MAANAQEEEAYLDGTHPALQANAQPSSTLRSSSPPLRSQADGSPSSSRSSSPRFSAVDDDAPPFVPPPVKAPTRGGGATNTGPKGVLADWQAANNKSTVTQTGPKGVLTDWRGNQAASGVTQQLAQISLEDGFDLDSDHLQDIVQEDGLTEARGEDAARETYRRKRIAELSGSGQREERARNKLFGHLREIGFDQFLPAVEDEEASVAVVLHLYEPEIEACAQLNQHLSALAREFPKTKFLRAMAGELDFAANAELETLPTVLVYRGGDLETTMVRMDQDWGRGTQAEVEALLRDCGAITGTATQPLGHRRVSSRVAEEDDDDE